MDTHPSKEELRNDVIRLKTAIDAILDNAQFLENGEVQITAQQLDALAQTAARVFYPRPRRNKEK